MSTTATPDDPAAPNGRRRCHWLPGALAGGVGVILAATLFQGVLTTATRLLLTGVVWGLGGVLGRWVWRRAARRRGGRAALWGVGGVVGAFLLLASRPLDPAVLRREYVAALCSYEGARYVWGGEMPWGIDCSGLARAALFRARVRQGLAQANPRGFGLETWRFWFRDLSATALRDGGRGYTRFLGEAESIAELDPLSLLPGDLAVTPDGIHALIYLGGSEWIDATPDYGRVVRHTPTSDPRYGYFHRPVVFLRWWCLDPL